MAKIFNKHNEIPYFHHKDYKTLVKYVNQFGKIEQRKKTGLTEMQQRRLATAIKRARHIGLVPFTSAPEKVSYHEANKSDRG